MLVDVLGLTRESAGILPDELSRDEEFAVVSNGARVSRLPAQANTIEPNVGPVRAKPLLGFTLVHRNTMDSAHSILNQIMALKKSAAKQSSGEHNTRNDESFINSRLQANHSNPFS